MTTHENETLETVPTPVPEWNPLATVEPVRRELKVSGGRAAVILRPWTGRERLAYEDAITESLLTTNEAGEDTVRMGALKLYAVSLTLVGSEGFPQINGHDAFSGDRRSRSNDLLSITDRATYDEIMRHALDVQPLPKADDGDDEDEQGDDEDPSPASSTRPTPTDDAGV